MPDPRNEKPMAEVDVMLQETYDDVMAELSARHQEIILERMERQCEREAQYERDHRSR